MTKVFFDTEFTGLHQNTTLISIGLVAETGETFYGEFTDYDPVQINPWLQENILDNLTHLGVHPSKTSFFSLKSGNMEVKGVQGYVKTFLTKWFKALGEVQIWSDCLAYDWVLFNSLLADYSQGYPQLPPTIHYIPMDLCTLLQVKGIDLDINREEFAGIPGAGKHNALHDARVIQACYQRLTQ